MQDPIDNRRSPFAKALKELPSNIATSLVCLAIVGAVLWAWGTFTSGSSLRSSPTIAAMADRKGGSVAIGVSSLEDKRGGCMVSFRLENTGHSLVARLGAQIEARASDGAALGQGVVLGSNIRVGGRGIDQAFFSNVSCKEMGSIFVDPSSDNDMQAMSGSVLPLEL